VFVLLALGVVTVLGDLDGRDFTVGGLVACSAWVVRLRDEASGVKVCWVLGGCVLMSARPACSRWLLLACGW
jgi:hypothetical protein